MSSCCSGVVKLFVQPGSVTESAFSTHDLDEAIEYQRVRSGAHSRVPLDKTSFGWSHRTVATERLAFGQVYTSGPQAIRATLAPSMVLLHLPVGDAADYRIGRRTLRALPDRAIVIPPEHSYTLVKPEGIGLSFLLRSDFLLEELQRLWPGRRGHAALKASELHLSPNALRTFLSFGETLRKIANEGDYRKRSIALHRLEQQSAAWLAAEIVRQEGVQPLSPRRHDRIKRIENWIDEHLQEEIDLDRLAGIGGVKAHALAKATLAARGLSPMGLVLSRRLEMSRRLLLAGKGKSVSEIAHYCGFSHLGRFALEYRAAFGEKPSSTLSRRRS